MVSRDGCGRDGGGQRKLGGAAKSPLMSKNPVLPAELVQVFVVFWSF